jgi:hypothetical protein
MIIANLFPKSEVSPRCSSLAIMIPSICLATSDQLGLKP